MFSEQTEAPRVCTKTTSSPAKTCCPASRAVSPTSSRLPPRRMMPSRMPLAPGAYGDLPRAILFDLDDTLLDYTGSAAECWRVACHAHAGYLPGMPPEQLLAAIDEYRHWYW